MTALQARDKGVPLPIHQLLVYPVTHHSFDSPSYREHASAKPLNAAMMRWFWGHYLSSEADGQNPYASPLHADLSGLPPATVILAEVDPLQSEGRAYADKLHAAGVPVPVTLYEGTMHEFFGMAAIIDEAKKAVAEAVKELNSSFKR